MLSQLFLENTIMMIIISKYYSSKFESTNRFQCIFDVVFLSFVSNIHPKFQMHTQLNCAIIKHIYNILIENIFTIVFAKDQHAEVIKT